MNYCGGIMYGLGLFGDVTVMNIVFYAFSRFPALVLAFLNFGVLGVGFGLIIGISTSLVYSIFRLRGKLARTSADFSTKRLLSFSCPLYVSNMLYLGQGWLDLVLLYALTGNSTLIGAYYLVIGGIYVISIFSTPVTFTLLPTMSHRYGENGIAGLEKPVSSAFRIMTIVVVPLSAGLAAVAPTALKVAYGSSYVQNSLAFALLATVAVFSGYWGILSSAFRYLRKHPGFYLQPS
jgi:O-antigen/teichoic acid export membrane protein